MDRIRMVFPTYAFESTTACVDVASSQSFRSRNASDLLSVSNFDYNTTLDRTRLNSFKSSQNPDSIIVPLYRPDTGTK